MKIFKRIIVYSCLLLSILTIICIFPCRVKAKGTTYIDYSDVYYAKENCKVYISPDYKSVSVTVIPMNYPVQVIGYSTNGWYRINLGYICYVKMDSLSSAGEFGTVNAKDVMGQQAMTIAKELGYNFHYISMNKLQTIEKSVFNRYINEKCILYTKINDELGVYFKIIYDDPATSDINLCYSISSTENADGSRYVYYLAPDETVLKGTIINFIFKVGYDKIVDNYIKSVDTGEYNLMNSFYTEYSEVSYAPVTQIGDMFIYERETMKSLSDNRRAKMNDIRKGIKYQEYDEKDYRSSISSKLRKDTEYIDYILQ